MTISCNISNPLLFDFYFGGLNSQIEHHLFPRVPHHRYRAMRPIVRAFCRERGLDPVQWALRAGEDYALILSVAPQRAAEVCRRIRQARCPAAVVGTFTKRRGAYRLLDARGKARSFEAGGWDHLRKR